MKTVSCAYKGVLTPGNYILVQSIFSKSTFKEYRFICGVTPNKSSNFEKGYTYAVSEGRVSFFSISSEQSFSAETFAISNDDSSNPYVYAELILLKV